MLSTPGTQATVHIATLLVNDRPSTTRQDGWRATCDVCGNGKNALVCRYPRSPADASLLVTITIVMLHQWSPKQQRVCRRSYQYSQSYQPE